MAFGYSGSRLYYLIFRAFHQNATLNENIKQFVHNSGNTGKSSGFSYRKDRGLLRSLVQD